MKKIFLIIIGFLFLPLFSHASTLNIYPQYDGYTQNYIAGGGTWSSQRNATTGSAAFNTDTNGLVCYLREDTAPTVITFDRGLVGFNMSTLPAGAVLQSATLHLYGHSEDQSHIHNSLDIISYNGTTTSTITTSDYNIANYSTSTLLGSIADTAFNTAGYNDFVLSTSTIPTTGMFSVGLLCSADRTNINPNVTSNDYYGIKFLENGSSTSPYITLNYTIPATPTSTETFTDLKLNNTILSLCYMGFFALGMFLSHKLLSNRK